MKHILQYIILITLILYGCSKNEYLDNDIEQTFIEFQSSNSTTIIPYNNTEDYIIKIPIQLFGKELEKTTSINVLISESSAIFNTQYFLDTIFSISKNTIIDTIEVTIKTSKITAGKNYSLQIQLQSNNSNIKVSNNYKNCSITFSKEKFIDFFTGNYSCFESSTNSTYDVIFTKKNDSIVENTNFWDFPYDGETIEYTFKQDEDKSIIIPESEWIDKLGNLYVVGGSGTYNINGNFTVNFYLKNVNGEIYQSGTHTFTKK